MITEKNYGKVAGIILVMAVMEHSSIRILVMNT